MVARIGRLHLEMPFPGLRMTRDTLRLDKFRIGCEHIATLMRKMGLGALHRKVNVSKKHPRRHVYRYLLHNLNIERANHVWYTDISHLPIRCELFYLAVILDWATRCVLARRPSITLATALCLKAL